METHDALVVWMMVLKSVLQAVLHLKTCHVFWDASCHDVSEAVLRLKTYDVFWGAMWG
jgi:hypothetical protein